MLYNVIIDNELTAVPGPMHKIASRNLKLGSEKMWCREHRNSIGREVKP